MTGTIRAEQLEKFREYLLERENAEATIQKYLTDIRTFIKYLGGEQTLDKKSILEYKGWLIERYAVNSVNSMLAALNQFLGFLGLDTLKVKRVRIQKSLFLDEEKELTKKEYQRLLRTAKSKGRHQLALCMETIAGTGVRVSELPYFTVESLKKERIEISNKGKYRRIYIPAVLRKKLLGYAGKHGILSGPIFVTRSGKPKSRSNIWREMKTLAEKAGVSSSKIFPHNLRHFFAQLYYEVTKDIAGLGDLLGHSSLNVTKIYISTAGSLHQSRLDKVDRIRMEMTT